ncbi:hypothetical protein [Algoriphagus chordae]|nr:hypothetical protein [Algoriphagus chordae]
MTLKTTLILVLCFFSSSTFLFAQSQDSTAFPYVLPIWGDKVQERGMADQLQLPFGFNVNYVNAYMELNITEFELMIGDKDFSGILNTETLNFTNVNATTNGANFRADAWVLPFMNVYGLFSTVTGGTDVTLQPTWRDATGEIILQLPEFSSNVQFDALAYGAGTTIVYGWNGYFSSIDMNYSRTDTELLEKQVGYLTLSARMGYRFFLNKNNKDLFLAPYMGIMYRNFVGDRGSNGNISMDEVFPGLDDAFNTKVDEKIASNDAIINDPSTSAAEKIKLQAQNQALQTIEDGVNESGIFTTNINYYIKKDLIQTVTFQFGFNLQLNKSWMLRGEYGVSDSQRFLMTGLQYRFGVKKKEFRN